MTSAFSKGLERTRSSHNSSRFLCSSTVEVSHTSDELHGSIGQPPPTTFSMPCFGRSFGGGSKSRYWIGLWEEPTSCSAMEGPRPVASSNTKSTTPMRVLTRSEYDESST